MQVMNQPASAGGVSWKYYRQQGIASKTTGYIEFTFNKVENWDKCVVLFEGIPDDYGVKKSTIIDYNINKTTNVIRAERGYRGPVSSFGRFQCTVIEFFGNARIFKGYASLNTGTTTIPCENMIAINSFVMSTNQIIQRDTSASQSSDDGVKIASWLEDGNLLLKASSPETMINGSAFTTWNVIELL